ncbi:hypothetical protein [Roseibium sediminis]|uniref:hypothetical protein n=1 Tax=Roseibium sediminis TaxID=1775174 RepID=UPI00123D494C|nr:hypothetical protein [Roseibium sediminis]
MGEYLKDDYGIDVFGDQDIYINLLVGNQSMSLDFDINKLGSIINNIFFVENSYKTIISPGKEEDHIYSVKILQSDIESYDISLRYTRSYNELRGEGFFKSMSMTAHPRFVALFLKSFLNEYSNDGFLYGLLEVVLVEINRAILREDLDQYTDQEISSILYKPLKSSHILYKINQGGWVDDHGNWHTYP